MGTEEEKRAREGPETVSATQDATATPRARGSHSSTRAPSLRSRPEALRVAWTSRGTPWALLRRDGRRPPCPPITAHIPRTLSPRRRASLGSTRKAGHVLLVRRVLEVGPLISGSETRTANDPWNSKKRRGETDGTHLVSIIPQLLCLES